MISNEHKAYSFIINLEIINENTRKSIYKETLTVCDTIEKCKEFTNKHIILTSQNKSSNMCLLKFSITDCDAIAYFTDNDRKLTYWYTFTPIDKYE